MTDSIIKIEEGSRPRGYDAVHCGCGEYRIVISSTKVVKELDVICPECGNHFGWAVDDDIAEDGDT